MNLPGRIAWKFPLMSMRSGSSGKRSQLEFLSGDKLFQAWREEDGENDASVGAASCHATPTPTSHTPYPTALTS